MSPTASRDARLEIELEGAVVRARLVDGEAVCVDERQVVLGELRAIAQEMGAICERGTRWGDVDQGSREHLRQYGALLFDSCLPGDVKVRLRALVGRAICLTLVMDEALAALPWELMHTGEVFIGLDFAVGRIVRGLQAETSVESSGGSRTLIVCDPRGDLIGSYYEGLTLRDSLATSGIAVDLRASEVRLADLRRLLREYDVVHFAGHAEHGGGSERGWWVADGVLGPSAIDELAGGRRFPRLVFSNACRSAGPELARAFLVAGVEHYIGTIQDVPDEPASLFALAFHAALRRQPGAGPGGAMRAARAALAERYGVTSVYWTAWVLYGPPARSSGSMTRALKLDAICRGSEIARTFNEVGARPRGAVAAVEGVSHPRLSSRASVRASGWIALLLVGLAAFGIGLGTSMGDAPHAPMTGLAIERTHQGQAFRVHVRAARDGVFGVWRVDAAGRVARVDVARGPLREIHVGEEIALPAANAAFWPAIDGGVERYYLAWRGAAPNDALELDADLARGMAAGRIDEVLADSFEDVTELLVPAL